MRLVRFLVFFSASVLLFGCAKEEKINNTESRVGESTVVFFPAVETKGNRLIILSQGQAYTEQGATAISNNQPVEVKINGSVNTAVPGVYVLRYEAESTPTGFPANDFRTVVVIGNDITDSKNLSGTYARYVNGAPNGQTTTWRKTARGVYEIENPGGAAGLTVTGVNYSGNNIAVPLQLTDVGEFYSTGGVYRPTATPPEFQWVIINATYGNAPRLFKKI
jgi:hypothetical protein